MSRPDLNAFRPGFFGKIPCAGDFVARGLDPEVRGKLDHFLAAGVAHLQRERGDTWAETFSRGCDWRFFAPAGSLGPLAYCGVVCASRDQVGRFFPVAGLVSLPHRGQALALSQPMEAALDRFEACFAAVLLGELAHVDDILAELEASATLTTLRQASDRLPAFQRSPLRFTPDWTSAEMAAALWIEQIGSGQSCWWRRRSDAAHLLVFGGLPSATQFAQMLLIESDAAPVKAPAVIAAVIAEPEVQLTNAEVVDATENEHSKELPWQDYVDPLSNVKLLFEDDEVVTEVPDRTAIGSSEPDSDLSHEVPLDLQARVEPREPEARPVSDKVGPAPVFAFSETGKVRTINEDSYWVDAQQQFWLVADGLGGLEQGDVASWAIVEACRGLQFEGDIFERTAQLKAAVLAVNQELFELNQQQSVRSGSTVVAALRLDDHCAVLWAGDSRLYHCSGARLEQITRDHTDTEGSSNRHSLSRAVGVAPVLELDVRFFSVQPGDRLLLCSDGVYNLIDSHSLRQAATIAGAEACGAAVRERVDATEASDNYTLIVIDIVGGVS